MTAKIFVLPRARPEQRVQRRRSKRACRQRPQPPLIISASHRAINLTHPHTVSKINNRHHRAHRRRLVGRRTVQHPTRMKTRVARLHRRIRHKIKLLALNQAIKCDCESSPISEPPRSPRSWLPEANTTEPISFGTSTSGIHIVIVLVVSRGQ